MEVKWGTTAGFIRGRAARVSLRQCRHKEENIGKNGDDLSFHLMLLHRYTLPPSLPPSLTHSLLSHTHTHTNTHTHTDTHTHTHTKTLTHTHTLTITHTHI